MNLSSKRQQLIETALTLFARRGFHATGIDRIAKQSGVTKKTLYSYFASKDELVVATLRHLDSQLRHYFLQHMNLHSNDPRERLLSLFDAAGYWFQEEHFFGCTFINAVAEYAEGEARIRQVCQEYKRLGREFIKGLCAEAGVREPQALSDALALLLEGAIVTAQVSPDIDAAQIARRAATVLLDAALAEQRQASS